MKTNVTEYDFTNAFQQIRPDNFSYQGLQALYEYMTELEDDMGEEFELDVIALCCDYSEFDSLEAINNEYGIDCVDIYELHDYTHVIVVPAFESTVERLNTSESYIINNF